MRRQHVVIILLVVSHSVEALRCATCHSVNASSGQPVSPNTCHAYNDGEPWLRQCHNADDYCYVMSWRDVESNNSQTMAEHDDNFVSTFDPNTNAMADYLHSVVNAEQHPTLAWIRSETRRRFPQWSMMTSSIDTARLLSTLACATSAQRIVEIGTFTGYSSLAMALAIKSNGGARMVCLDNSEEFTHIARQAWKRASVDSIVELRLGDASESLRDLVEDAQWSGNVDMVFIDADKQSQWHYFQQSMRLVRRRGLVVIDNTIWSGAALDPADSSGIRRFNEMLAQDERCQSVLLPFSDGITIVCKK